MSTPMSEDRLRQHERWGDKMAGAEASRVRELVAEVRHLRQLVYGQTVNEVTTIHGGKLTTYAPSLAEQAASDLEERRYWEARTREAERKLATAVEALHYLSCHSGWGTQEKAKRALAAVERKETT